MTYDTPQPQMLGFEKCAELEGVFSKFGILKDFKSQLPEHLLNILRRQHPAVVIEKIELLDTPLCNLGGMQQEQDASLVRVQTLDVSLHLRVTLLADSVRVGLEIELVFRGNELDTSPSVTSDMFVKSQSVIQDNFT
jgi:hypothetical protein